MTEKINKHRWKFLQPEKATDYIALYNKHRERGWKELVPDTTHRQFETASEILDRMHGGQRGVLLADDVGLGKTTIAVFCALVFAGSGKDVRILAPNEMMARRWRQELEIHIEAFSRFAGHLELERAMRRIKHNIERLTPGSISVTTHQKAAQLSCDLLIVDEAHRTRSEHSTLAKQIRHHGKSVAHFLILTATPFSIDPNDLARLLSRIGGSAAEKPMRNYADMLDNLWRGKLTGEPGVLAPELTRAAREALEAMAPFVIRRGINDLPVAEQRAFGAIQDEAAGNPPVVPDSLLEAMLRTDRALALGHRCGVWDAKRRNDPRYHVANDKLKSDLADLINTMAQQNGSEAVMALSHGETALRQICANGTHPKIADTVRNTRALVEQGEKVLIFCDHHFPAEELTRTLADELRWPDKRGVLKSELWESAWSAIFSDIRKEAENSDGRDRSHDRIDNFLAWLTSCGVRLQIESWMGDKLQQIKSARPLIALLRNTPVRSLKNSSITGHAEELYRQLTDPESGSTRAILLHHEVKALPGATRIRVAAVCNPEEPYPGVIYPNEPDAILAVFNSPFGPDVLVATDRLSEGVDLHRFCRHLIHHELDPSPVRTIQRNGRLRRVNSWAARTNKPIRIFYPALQGTRDERLVNIMRQRLQNFDLLFGGIRTEISYNELDFAALAAGANSSLPSTLMKQVLDAARDDLSKLKGRLGLKRRRKSR